MKHMQMDEHCGQLGQLLGCIIRNKSSIKTIPTIPIYLDQGDV